MREGRYRLVRLILASIIPAALLAACGASTSEPSENRGGAGGVAGGGSGGSPAGAGSGGVSNGSGAAGMSGEGGSVSHAGAATGGNAGASGAGTGGASGGNSGGPVACGGSICGPQQFCVIPCCGGAPPACVPKFGDGSCPPGTHAGCTFNLGSCTTPGSCCQSDPCTPPPPYCSDTKPNYCFPENERTCRLMCA